MVNVTYSFCLNGLRRHEEILASC